MDEIFYGIEYSFVIFIYLEISKENKFLNMQAMIIDILLNIDKILRKHTN